MPASLARADHASRYSHDFRIIAPFCCCGNYTLMIASIMATSSNSANSQDLVDAERLDGDSSDVPEPGAAHGIHAPRPPRPRSRHWLARTAGSQLRWSADALLSPNLLRVWGVKAPRRSPRRRNGRGPARSWKYRGWIRSLPCAACGAERDVQAAHTVHNGMASKGSDFSCVPPAFLPPRLRSGLRSKDLFEPTTTSTCGSWSPASTMTGSLIPRRSNEQAEDPRETGIVL